MEFVQDVDKTTGAVKSRVAIPDAVVAASDNRDLVGKYASAGESQRKQIHEDAIKATTPVKAEPKAEGPAETDAVEAE